MAPQVVRVWDSSNVAEDLPGVVSPLSFTVFRHAGHEVFAEYFRALWMPARDRRRLDRCMGNLQGQFFGRVYDDVANMYELFAALPLFRVVRKQINLTMGLDPADAAAISNVTPFAGRTTLERGFIRLVIGTRFWWLCLTADRRVRAFIDHFDEVAASLTSVDYNELTPEAIYERVVVYEREVLGRWAETLPLDAVHGISYALLAALTKRWMPDAPTWVLWAAARPADAAATLDPVLGLDELADVARKDEVISSLFDECDLGSIAAALRAAGKDGFVERAQAYTQRFRHRTLHEVKLEEPTLGQTDDAVFMFIRSAMSGASVKGRVSDTWDLDGYLASHVGGLRRLAYRVVQRRVSQSAALRETVRVRRSDGWGILKHLLRALGEKLADAGVVSRPDDIYWLRLEEARAYFDGTLSDQELQHLVPLRRAQSEDDERWSGPRRFVTREASVSEDALREAGWARRETIASAQAGEGPAHLVGTPCSPGVAEGTAKVPQTLAELADSIGDGADHVLVLESADPGWVPLLPSVAAVVVERGNPLSHLAVVARELQVPMVVQVDALRSSVQPGMWVRVDGDEGHVVAEARHTLSAHEGISS